jgi:hypothetical protein
MTCHCSPSRPAPLYLIEASFGRRGRAFIETDRDANSRDKVVELIRSGEVTPVKIICVDEDAGSVCDVTSDIMKLVQAAHAADEIAAVLDRQAATFDHARDLRKHEVA